MGGKMSKAAFRAATRPFRNFDIENRAQKAVEDHKVNPKVAPYYPSTVEGIEKTLSETQHIKEELEKKDTQTIQRMYKLQIETTGTKPDLGKKKEKESKLPQRRYILDPYLAMEQPESVPKGKLSLQNVGEILDMYKTDPKKDTVKKVANDFNVDLLTSGLLVKYFEKIDYEDKKLTDEKGKKLKEKFIRMESVRQQKARLAESDKVKLSDFALKPEVDGNKTS